MPLNALSTEMVIVKLIGFKTMNSLEALPLLDIMPWAGSCTPAHLPNAPHVRRKDIFPLRVLVKERLDLLLFESQLPEFLERLVDCSGYFIRLIFLWSA